MSCGLWFTLHHAGAGRASRVFLLSRDGRLGDAHPAFISGGGQHMILKMCARCKRPTVYPARYCSVCAPVVRKEIEAREAEQKSESMRRYNRRRNPKYSRFYHSDEWKNLSTWYLTRHLYCEDCGEIAVEVHHVKPIQTEEGWNRRFDVTNLRSQCLNCHNAKHDRFQKRNVRISEKT